MAAVSVVTTVSVDGKDLAEVLKGLQEQLDTQKQLSEKLEARLTEETAAQARLEARLAEEQAAREDAEGRLLKEAAAREALESRLTEAIRIKADAAELVTFHSALPLKAGLDDLKPLQMQVEALKAELAVLQAELPNKASTEEVKGMQRDLVVQLWSMKGTGVTGPPVTKWESAAAVV